MTNSTGLPRFRGPRAASVRAGRALLAVLCLGGCTGLRVPKPDSDSTPPSLVWNVFNHDTREQADHPGSPTLHVKRGHSFRIVLKAKDPQGISAIRINPTVGSGRMEWKCTGSGSIAQIQTVTLAPMTQNLSPNSDGTVLTAIFLIYEMDLALPCNPGFITYDSGSAELTGQAANYFNGVTTEKLTFIVTP